MTFVAPSSSTFACSSRARPSCFSTATTSPASCVALPPGAAQRSSVRSPSRAPTASPASCEPAALRPDEAPLEPRRLDPVDAQRVGQQRIRRAGDHRHVARRRLSRTTVSGGSFCAASSARASSAPKSRQNVSATQSGYEWRSAASCGVPSGSVRTSARPPSATRRMTAFVNATARSSPAPRTSSTDSFAAARAGTASR